VAKTQKEMNVHYMQYGMTACLVNGPPKDWPEDHKWSSDWKDVTCQGCLAGKELVSTYRVAEDGKSITCLRCNRTSHHPKDVKNHYCGWCCAFHDDIWPPARAAWLKSPPPTEPPGHAKGQPTHGKMRTLEEIKELSTYLIAIADGDEKKATTLAAREQLRVLAWVGYGPNWMEFEDFIEHCRTTLRKRQMSVEQFRQSLMDDTE
jgi:hypothetical protein